MTSDSKREEIKQQMLNWLSQEKDWQVMVSKEYEERYNYYFFCRVIFSEDMNCSVAIEKDVERVNIMIDAPFVEDDASSYKLSPTPDKGRFWLQMKITLAQIGVNVAPIPNVEQLARLQVNKPIYFDGWSHDKFIETLFKVADGIEVAELFFKSFAESMRQRHQKQD
jgi:hypothetical protein